MSAEPPLRFKIADAGSEFEAIHRLNYKTFAEEIPQHGRNSEQRLVDRFHHENTYVICLHGGSLVAMLAGRGTRPFSLDVKVPNLDSHLPAGHKLLEIRLLSIEQSYRKGFILPRLVNLFATHFSARGYDMAIISGVVHQLRLYKHVGFVPFGPVVGSREAQFQPMYLPLAALGRISRAALHFAAEGNGTPTYYIPGQLGSDPALQCWVTESRKMGRSQAVK
jgi:hypothetical protein